MLLGLGDFDWTAGEEHEEQERAPDPQEEDALAALRDVFTQQRERVFFGRQLAVQHEDPWFHWITHRALSRLEDEGFIKGEDRPLQYSDQVHLMWHRSYRYPRRQADRVVGIIESYSNPLMSSSIGRQGEWLVLEGFMRRQFVLVERAANNYRGRVWTGSNHNLDFVIERDGVAYGVEVKNTLAYMDYDELLTKTKMCLWLGVRPIFAVRMLPRTWANTVIRAGGYAMIMKYQFYPWLAEDLAQTVRTELELPVDTPKALYDGTMDRFERWHIRQIE
jgi:hypothetical protein